MESVVSMWSTTTLTTVCFPPRAPDSGFDGLLALDRSRRRADVRGRGDGDKQAALMHFQCE
ncbi:hypothetical protein DI273_00010 [Streptomyces violascens]|nr:hypothetical protein DI273_00010 [Streptomyces violascens]